MTKKKPETKAEKTPEQTATEENQLQDNVIQSEGNTETEEIELSEEGEQTAAEKGEAPEGEDPENKTGKTPEDPKPKVSVSGMEKYFEAYPENKVFYWTSDGQVFLEKNKSLALDHQRRQEKGELETIKRP